jgi:hypothetical protein
VQHVGRGSCHLRPMEFDLRILDQLGDIIGQWSGQFAH